MHIVTIALQCPVIVVAQGLSYVAFPLRMGRARIISPLVSIFHFLTPPWSNRQVCFIHSTILIERVASLVIPAKTTQA